MKPTRLLAQRIDRYVLPWRQLAWPPDWSRVFGREAPLGLEIGFGNGEFLEAEAREHPERDYVGIEISWGSVLRLMHRADKSGLRNVRVAIGDAELLTGLLFAAESLSECILNHPCPWPKERHHKRRLIQAPFLEVLADRLRTGAPVTIQTDHTDYAEWIGAALEAQSNLVFVARQHRGRHPWRSALDQVPAQGHGRRHPDSLLSLAQGARPGAAATAPVPDASGPCAVPPRFLHAQRHAHRSLRARSPVRRLHPPGGTGRARRPRGPRAPTGRVGSTRLGPPGSWRR